MQIRYESSIQMTTPTFFSLLHSSISHSCVTTKVLLSSAKLGWSPCSPHTNQQACHSFNLPVTEVTTLECLLYVHMQGCQKHLLFLPKDLALLLCKPVLPSQIYLPVTTVAMHSQKLSARPRPPNKNCIISLTTSVSCKLCTSSVKHLVVPCTYEPTSPSVGTYLLPVTILGSSHASHETQSNLLCQIKQVVYKHLVVPTQWASPYK